MNLCEQSKLVFPNELIPRKGQRIVLEISGNHYEFLMVGIISTDWIRDTEKGYGLIMRMEGVLGDRITK